MDLKNQQKTFDDIKWYDSIVAGEDRCGSYDFCQNCNKDEAFPCARAKERACKKDRTRIATIYLQIGEKK